MREYITDFERSQEIRKLKVVKANDLIQKTKYDMSAQQQKILAYAIAKIKPEDIELHKQKFLMREFCNVIGIEYNFTNRKRIYDNIQKIRDSSFIITIDKKDIITSWFLEARIDLEKNDEITIQLSESLAPYLLELKEYFTSYYLAFIAPMSNKYSMRLYEILKSYSYNYLEFEIDIDELKAKLKDKDDKKPFPYDRFNNFKVKVLEPVQDEINRFTDLTVQYTPIREGKEYKKIRFVLMEKSKKDVEEILLNNTKAIEAIEYIKGENK